MNMPPWLTNTPFLQALLAAVAMASACAVLSVFVVLRRWAFVGEGISHSGFGGAGMAWVIMLAAPALATHLWVLYAAVVLITEPGTMDIEWGSAYSTDGSQTPIGGRGRTASVRA